MSHCGIFDEEVEVKIEYLDLSETDPLCETAEEITMLNENFNETTLETTEVDKEPKASTVLENKEEFCMATPTSSATWYKSIDNIGKYTCKFCELTYHTVYTLRRHITTKHPDAAITLKQAILNNKRKKKIICHICKERFETITHLQKHSDVTHDIKNTTSCHICKAKFVNLQAKSDHLLNEHNVTSTMYCCDVCGYQTPKKSHYKQHCNTHSESNKIWCPSCSYSTNNLSNMTIHTRIHTKEMAYECDFNGCSYKCVAKSALKSHQLKHDREAYLLYCDKCTYRTVYKQSLRTHMDSHSRDSVRKRLAQQK